MNGISHPQTPLQTPVALFVFNRPKETAEVFAAVAKAKPKILLINADGPRPTRPEDIA